MRAAVMRRAVVVGHADADGHLITEQVRRNLELTGAFEVSAVVDPEITKDHRAWTRLDEIKRIENASFVFLVDLMFAPDSFVNEATAFVRFAKDRPEKLFLLIDHHPLPYRRLSAAENVRAIYRPDVFDVAVGPRSGIMVVAALCENQGPLVASVKRPEHVTLATGMRRAAAIGGPLPGEKLLALLKFNCWNALAELGNEAREFHHLPRGRRSGRAESRSLKSLDTIAERLLEQGSLPQSQLSLTRDRQMSYDFEIGQERFERVVEHAELQPQERTSPKDLEAIVTLLEVAAISLTTEPGCEFSFEQLSNEAREILGGEMDFDDRDMKIVLEKARFVERRPGSKLRLR